MTISRKYEVKLTIPRSFFDFLGSQKTIDEDLVKPTLSAVAKQLVGKNQGQDPRSSIIGKHFARNNARRYDFAPLSAKYAAWKQRKVGNKPILVLSGKWERAALRGRLRFTSKGGRFRPFRPPKYAKYTEFGTKKMPARPAFTVNNQDERELDKFVDQVVSDIMDSFTV